MNVLVSLVGVGIILGTPSQAQKANVSRPETAVSLVTTDFWHPNPNAPKELQQFAFIIGRWRCESTIKQPDGKWTTYEATLVGRYILDGYVIADEFRQFGPGGELMQYGQNYRSYNRENGWVMRWARRVELDLARPRTT
jgi:hypothetical protein